MILMGCKVWESAGELMMRASKCISGMTPCMAAC